MLSRINSDTLSGVLSDIGFGSGGEKKAGKLAIGGSKRVCLFGVHIWRDFFLESRDPHLASGEQQNSFTWLFPIQKSIIYPIRWFKTTINNHTNHKTNYFAPSKKRPFLLCFSISTAPSVHLGTIPRLALPSCARCTWILSVFCHGDTAE